MRGHFHRPIKISDLSKSAMRDRIRRHSCFRVSPPKAKAYKHAVAGRLTRDIAHRRATLCAPAPESRVPSPDLITWDLDFPSPQSPEPSTHLAPDTFRDTFPLASQVIKLFNHAIFSPARGPL
jgi:hypothetical protein